MTDPNNKWYVFDNPEDLRRVLHDGEPIDEIIDESHAAQMPPYQQPPQPPPQYQQQPPGYGGYPQQPMGYPYPPQQIVYMPPPPVYGYPQLPPAPSASPYPQLEQRASSGVDMFATRGSNIPLGGGSDRSGGRIRDRLKAKRGRIVLGIATVVCAAVVVEVFRA